MEGESVMTLEQAYLERCDQLLCVRYSFTYLPMSPSKQLGEAGDNITIPQGRDSTWTNSMGDNATTHLTDMAPSGKILLSALKLLAAGPGMSTSV